MKKLYTLIIITLITACASQEQVKTACLDYLKSTYRQDFIIEKIDMNHNEGNWGRADVMVYPASRPELKFKLVYNYSREKITWDDYKGAFWNAQIKEDLIKKLPKTVLLATIKTRLKANNSIVFATKELPFYANYQETIQKIAHPRIYIELDLSFSTKVISTEQLIKILMKTADFFMQQGIEKFALESKLKIDEKSFKLFFRYTKEHSNPSFLQIKELLIPEKEKIISDKVNEIFKQAKQLQINEEYLPALKAYQNFIQKYYNPYRYHPYIGSESGVFLDAAFESAKIAKQMPNVKIIRQNYLFILELLRYTEAKNKYAQYEKEAKIWLENN